MCLFADDDIEVDDLKDFCFSIVLLPGDLLSKNMAKLALGSYCIKLPLIWECLLRPFVWLKSDIILACDFSSKARRALGACRA
jgi:hypothetical protein